MPIFCSNVNQAYQEKLVPITHHNDASIVPGYHVNALKLVEGSSENGPSLLKKSSDEFIRMRTSVFSCQITANWFHISEFSDVFLLGKALQ